MTSIAPHQRTAAPSDDASEPAPATWAAQRARLDARMHAGGVLILRGPPGLGKRQMLEAALSAHGDRARFFAELPLGGGPSFAAAREVVTAILRWAEPSDAEALGRQTETLRGSPGCTAEPGATPPPAADPLRCLLECETAFRWVLKRTPAVFVFHHIEHADPDTQNLLQHLAETVFDPDAGPTPHPGTLVLIADDSAETVAEPWYAALKAPYVTELTLAQLEREELRQYVCSEPVLKRLLDVSNGRPGDLERLLASLPTGVDGLLESRLRQLDPKARQILSAIAVSPTAVHPSEVAAVAELTAATAATELARLVEAQLLAPVLRDGTRNFQLQSTTDRPAILRSLGTGAEARWHQRWADALTKLYRPVPLARWVHHQLGSDAPEEAIGRGLALAESHAIAGAFAQASRLLMRLEPLAKGRAEHGEILRRLVALLPLSEGPERALRYAEMWQAIAKAGEGIDARLAEAELLNTAGQYHRTLRRLEAPRDAEAPAPSPVQAARIALIRSEAHYHLGALEEALRTCGDARAHAGESGPLQVVLRIANQAAKISMQRGEIPEAMTILRDVRGRAEGLALATERARAEINLGICLLRSGQPEDAERQLETGIAVARRAGALALSAFGWQALGAIRHRRADLSQALRAYRASRAAFRQLGQRTQYARATHNMALVYSDCGDRERAQALNQEARRIAMRTQSDRLLAAIGCLDAYLGASGDRIEASSEALSRASDAAAARAGDQAIETRLLLAELCLEAGRSEPAAAALDAARVHLDTHSDPRLHAWATLLGAQLRTAADPEAALRELRPSRTALEHQGALPLLQKAHRAEAACYRALGQVGAAADAEAEANKVAERIADRMPARLAKRYRQAQTRRAPVAPQSWRGDYRAIVGDDPKLHQVFRQLDRLAPSDATVLIAGESGTGKELIAEALHQNSPRADGPFVRVHCAALVDSLLMSELFGHERGAFTGAHQQKIGRFERAAGGTLFLDEIGDISPATQIALLRVLQERSFERVGGGTPVQVDVRVVVATHRDLPSMVAQGQFREDLYYRLAGLCLHVPALRERSSDVPELVRHFAAAYAKELNQAPRPFTEAALEALSAHPWPGNIRELENVVRSAILFSDGPAIEASALKLSRPAQAPADPILPSPAPAIAAAPVEAEAAPAAPDPAAIESALVEQVLRHGIPLPELKRRVQRQAIERALTLTGGNITQAARRLGMRRPRLSQIVNGDDALRSLLRGGTP